MSKPKKTQEEEFSYWKVNTPGTFFMLKLPIYTVLLMVGIVLYGSISDALKESYVPEPWPKLTKEDTDTFSEKNWGSKSSYYPKVKFDNTVKLKVDGITIELTPQQILEQIDFDYDDLKDYLGNETR